MTAFRFLALAVLVSALPGCQRALPEATAPPALFATTWHVTALTEQVNQTAPVDLFGGAQPCWNDNVYEFRPQGEFALTEGPTTCNAEDPASRTGRWHYNPSTQYLQATIAFGPPSAGPKRTCKGSSNSARPASSP